MKYHIALLVCAAVFSGQTAIAQTSTPLTHAQVLAELYRLEAAGYNPSAGDQGTYPDDIQAAEAKVAAQQANQSTPATVARAPRPGLPEPTVK
ncbi:DUF4148 domain-containing protein [Burkholderia sp. Ac-20353]|uniref:DUF4148 domain-containing protein n=1 Tax=Burkholderia sp. Ac-20353 TaxID=2703894 RepID=UPI00197C9118|nr:DUF4148 domain-containing protein [Burkholderia sp. Ac-20353]MBN3786875.1 DUF4148 domain-containing protein [Burkholderia sp. Ac-20353]